MGKVRKSKPIQVNIDERLSMIYRNMDDLRRINTTLIVYLKEKYPNDVAILDLILSLGRGY